MSLALALVMALSLAIPAHAATVSTKAGANLTPAEQKIYKALESTVIEVAAGNKTSPEVTISFAEKELVWTAQELGLSSITAGQFDDAVHEKIGVIMDKIYTCSELNHPFELFWANNYWSWIFWAQNTSNEVWLTELTCTYDVSLDYRGSSVTTVDPAKIAQANAVKDMAKSIVQANEGKSDYEKLAAYRDKICELNTYNDEANDARKQDKDPYARDHTYGDPWQMVYVFDGDPSTNVLCEGYAKAFKYLCDLTEFAGDVTCYIVEGDGDGEAHMWNVVGIDGAFYPADITYIDTGAPESLFLAGATGSGRTYTVSAGGERYTYIYREDQEGLFTDGYLPLSPTAYSPEQSAKPQPKPVPEFTDTPDWCKAEAQWAAQEGITNGYGAQDKFAPGLDCSQQEILTFLWRAAGRPEAKEKAPVTVASYYQDAVNWAYEQGYVGEGFDPAAACTRAQAVSYIWKALGEQEAKQSADFTDVDAEAPYAKAVDWAVEKGITKGDGSGDTFAPDKVCSRGHIACFLYRAYN